METKEKHSNAIASLASVSDGTMCFKKSVCSTWLGYSEWKLVIKPSLLTNHNTLIGSSCDRQEVKSSKLKFNFKMIKF